MDGFDINLNSNDLQAKLTRTARADAVRPFRVLALRDSRVHGIKLRCGGAQASLRWGEMTRAASRTHLVASSESTC